MTYKLVQYYMALKMNVANMKKDSAEENLRTIWIKIIVTTDMVDSNGKLNCMVYQSSYQYGGIRSGINHVYILARVQIPETMKRELSTFITVMERTVIA